MPSRRRFFLRLLDEVVATVDEARGKRSLKLAEFGALDDASIGSIVPAHAPGLSIAVQGQSICCTCDETPIGSVPMNTRDEDVFWSIDGQRSVEEIAAYLCAPWQDDYLHTFGEVRRCVIDFVARRLCVPVNVPGDRP